jgi:glycerol kinase
MGRYVLAIDQGTTGTTALILDKSSLKMIAEHGIDYPQIYPQPGWVEHDLNQIWETVRGCVIGVLKKAQVEAKEIESIGITNQRETTCAYDKHGKPLYHALVWQDRRAQKWCQENTSRYGDLSKKTGLPLDAYFSATKMSWLLNNAPSVKQAAQNGDLHFSTIDTFILFRLTNGASFLTEPTNASRTLLMNLKDGQWDDELLRFFEIDKKFLPDINETFSHFGTTKGLDFLPDNIPITCLIGDQQSALFGQACIKPGDLKCTYGTGAFLLQQTGNKLIFSKHGLLSTCSYKYKNQMHYALEGSVYIAGAAVQWLRDNLGMIEKSHEVETLARQVSNLTEMNYILFAPYFSGIGTPHWKSDAKAAIVGLTRDTQASHVARACLEGIALSINDCIETFQKDFGALNDIKVDGGATANNLLMEIQASFSNQKISRPKNIESTSMGAAIGSLVGSNQIKLEDVDKSWTLDRHFEPSTYLKEYSELKKNQWKGWISRLYL